MSITKGNNPDVCKELLEILLEIKIDHIDMRQEEEVAIDYGKKAIENALLLIKKYKATPESAAKDMNAPLELVLEELAKTSKSKTEQSTD